jgi:prepilin peptidase CpaA
MSISLITLSVFSAAAAYTDIRFRRIPNLLVIAGLLSGIIVRIITEGITKGLLEAAIGTAAGFLIMLLFYMVGAIGAGDVKLFGAIGAISGLWVTMSAITYSVLFAGLIGLIILIRKKELLSRGTSIIWAIFGIICLKRLDAARSMGPRQEMIRFPFMLAVIPGLIAAYWELQV